MEKDSRLGVVLSRRAEEDGQVVIKGMYYGEILR